MVTKRIIPCLDIRDGAVVKGINFEGIKEVGNPIDLAKKYSDDGADELVFLDISATLEARKTFHHLVKDIALEINIPFTVGGGISSVDDAEILLSAGADKVSINSAAVRNPDLIYQLAKRYGSQFVVIAIDAKIIDGQWMVTTHGGQRATDLALFEWAKRAQDLGAGELLFTSMEHDGTKNGYACEQYQRLSQLLEIPIIASGGAGNADHIVEVLQPGIADAALAASIFHYGEIQIQDLKQQLAHKGVYVRK